MDERLKYEQLIGEKLQSLPIPDMQDAIWARVKAQLDIDLPTDDNDGGSSPQSPSGPGIIGWGLSVVIIALVTTFFILKNKPKKQDQKNNSTTTEQVSSPSVRNNGPPLPNNSTIKRTNTPLSTGADNSIPVITNDSAMQQDLGIAEPVRNDSMQINLPPPLVTVPPPKTDTTAQVKKGRGMPVNDSNYRIVPKNKN
ncbi:MAG: hypothetical protein J7502_07175 [Flavisolibacter sp.]|nr:hypothetical protein [Flavisolibacter sp.]